MNILVQGMRRSGTTILYDLLSEDPALTGFYEPLGMDKVAVGGGSGVREHDVLEATRRARAAFVADHPGIEDAALLNHGAPRDWGLEFEPGLPGYVRDFLRFLLDRPSDVVLKCTRMYRKVAVLAQVDPQALFVHVVRDPRAVAASYLLGRGASAAACSPTRTRSSPRPPTTARGRATRCLRTFSGCPATSSPGRAATSSGSCCSGATRSRRRAAPGCSASATGTYSSATRTCRPIRRPC